MSKPDEMLAQLTGGRKRITRQISVLAVDDAAFNLSAVRRILKQGGYGVSVATSGRDALDALSRTLIDVAVFDIEMPEMSGIELYARMLEDPAAKSIPVVFVTGDNDPPTEKKATEMGASGYIVKPYTDTVLLGKVQAAADAGKIDQGLLYLLKRLRKIRDAAQAGKLAEAAEAFDEIPADVFNEPVAAALKRLEAVLSGGDAAGVVRESGTILGELEAS